jgi:hypothetical protein
MTISRSGQEKDEKPDTTTNVLRQLVDPANKLLNGVFKQDQYAIVPFYEKRPTLDKKYSEKLGDELVVSSAVLDQFNSRKFIYKEKTIVGQTIAKVQVMFAKPLRYIAYAQLRIAQQNTTSKLDIVNLGEHGFGLIAKKVINKGEKLFYAGVLSSWQDIDPQPYTASISLGGPEPSMVIDAANCDKSYAQHIRYTPEKNLSGNPEISVSNANSCLYYTDIWIAKRRTLIPLVAMEFSQSVQPQEGIFTSSEDRYPAARSQAPTLFSKTFKPILAEVRLTVSEDKGDEFHDTYLTLSEKGMKDLIKDGYLNLERKIAILPKQSRERLKETFKSSHFKGCNGLKLPSIILANKKFFSLGMIDKQRILVALGLVTKEELTNQQLGITGDVNKPNLFVPIALLQNANQAELNELINEIKKITGCKLLMHCDQALLEQVSEDKKEESSPRNAVRL